ncbi:pseudaminic acid synthase [Gracilibacillus phocaeensis]|uniref:pseudaminic acid synthase n=1 Tax=Gracilibacillus phocaeensis TaxID=2042304 RepID=UPI002570ABB0|nr:pseudaminic acid synthase [Gracilibacillus phocaeensis]
MQNSLFSEKPFIIAEMSGNHNHSLARALDIVEAAAKAGVDALKLQTYTADSMTLDVDRPEFMIQDEENLWNGKHLYDLYKEAYTPWEWHKPIFQRCHELGLIAFSSPFDENAVDFLEKLDVPFYKIASFENIHLPLIKKVASTGKPMIISTGMATISEIDEAVRVARENGCEELVLLKCTSTYPASPSESNISTIPHLKQLFNCTVGISDHTLGIGVSIASVALGGQVIEKHFTLSRANGGVDAEFSLEPYEMKQLVEEANRTADSIGKVSYGTSDKEEQSRSRRRSIYISKDMYAGDIITENNIKIVRPGFGLAPKYFDIVLGKQVNQSVQKGTPLRWELI